MQRRLETERARQQQAELISAWYGENGRIYLRNGSSSLVYEVVVAPVAIQGEPVRSLEEAVALTWMHSWVVFIGLQPGVADYALGLPYDIDVKWHSALELAFTDQAGQHWLRRKDGRLEELPTAPVEYLKVEKPVDYKWAQTVS